MDWYLLQFKPNAHGVAAENLRAQGFGVFLPLHRVTQRRRSGFRDALRPLFPGYMFAGLSEASPGLPSLRATRGVSRAVSFGGACRPVPGELVEALRARCDAGGVLQSGTPLAAGDRVRVLSGPFAAYAAEVERVEEGRRVWILLDLASGRARIPVGAADVELAENK